MEIGDKFKHSSLKGYFFEITENTNKGYKGIESHVNAKGKMCSKTAFYNRSYFNNLLNGWIKI